VAVRLRSAYVASYSRLARMAFLIGAPQRDRQQRAGRAHRLARRVLPWRAGPELDPEDAARSLLARLIRAALRRGDRAPWGWRGTPAPPAGGHAAIDAALATAPPAARAGYALLVAERLSRSAAADVLRAAGITETGGALYEAAKVRDRLAERDGLTLAEQHDLITQTPMDPTVVRLRAPDPLALRLRRLALVAGVLVLAAVLAGAVTVLVTPAASVLAG
jgi:hypothetical protein